MNTLFPKPEPIGEAETRKAARIALAKMLGKFGLYVVGLLAIGVGFIFWFILAVLLQPFRGDGVND